MSDVYTDTHDTASLLASFVGRVGTPTQGMDAAQLPRTVGFSVGGLLLGFTVVKAAHPLNVGLESLIG